MVERTTEKLKRTIKVQQIVRHSNNHAIIFRIHDYYPILYIFPYFVMCPVQSSSASPISFTFPAHLYTPRHTSRLSFAAFIHTFHTTYSLLPRCMRHVIIHVLPSRAAQLSCQTRVVVIGVFSRSSPSDQLAVFLALPSSFPSACLKSPHPFHTYLSTCNNCE